MEAINFTLTRRNVSASPWPVSVDAAIILSVLLATLAVTLVINCLMIVTIVRTPGLRTNTNAFLLSLSASDQLYALVTSGTVATIIIYYFHNFYYNLITLENCSLFAWGILIHSSNGNLILVSLERWLYITLPFWYHRIVSRKTVIASITATWVSAIVVNLPYVFPSFASKRGPYFVTLHGYFYPATHTICCFLLVLIYAHISAITFQQVKKISQIQPHPHQPATSNQVTPFSKRAFHIGNWRAIKLLITVCGLFFLLVSPYVYYFSYTLLHPRRALQLAVWRTPLLMLLSIYHCSNFFVYVLRMRQFRRVLRDDFKKLTCCHRDRFNDKWQSERATSVSEVQSRV